MVEYVLSCNLNVEHNSHKPTNQKKQTNFHVEEKVTTFLEEAKMQTKVTSFTLVTAYEHLAQTRLIVSAMMYHTSREVIKNAQPEYPIRRILAIFFTYYDTMLYP